MTDPNETYYDTPQELFAAHAASKGPTAAYDDDVHRSLGFTDAKGHRHLVALTTVQDRAAYIDKGKLPDGFGTLIREPVGRGILFNGWHYSRLEHGARRWDPRSWLLGLLACKAEGQKLLAVERPPIIGYREADADPEDPRALTYLIFTGAFDGDPAAVPRVYAEMLRTPEGRKKLIEGDTP